MRRSDREITDFQAILQALDACTTLHVGFRGGDYPYVVPLSFGYEVVEDKLRLYVHGAREGMRHDLLRADDRLCIAADCCIRFVETGHSLTCTYESVIGFGRGRVVSGEEALHGIQLLNAHCGFPNFEVKPEAMKIVSVWRIDVESITGKKRVVE